MSSKIEKFSGEGTQPLPRPLPPQRLPRLDPRAYRARPRPQGRLPRVLWAPSDAPVTEIDPQLGWAAGLPPAKSGPGLVEFLVTISLSVCLSVGLCVRLFLSHSLYVCVCVCVLVPAVGHRVPGNEGSQRYITLSVCLSVLSSVFVSHSVTVYLSVCLSVTVPASIEPSDTEYQVMQDHNVMLRCRSSGIPQPTVHWKKNGVSLTDRDFRYRLLRSGWLAIAVVRYEHSQSLCTRLQYQRCV